MKQIYLPALLLFFATAAFGQQSSQAYRKLADSLFQFHHYQDAAHYYEMAIRKSTEPGNIMIQVARSYGKVKNNEEALKWFGKAKENNATFSGTDTYEYVEVLMTMQKRKEAENVLLDVLKNDPNALYAREALDDVLHYEKYFKDSISFHVTPLPVNTPESEFAPAYYKDGIVYTSAQREKFARKKYHWDNSNFLNLYFSKKEGSVFQKPVLFEKELNTRFHDGPATFYANQERMIVNRNQPVKQEGKDNSYVWHLALFDAQRSGTGENISWQVTHMPFDQPPYSFAHPAVSEDGQTLYFVSDIPGGYGGTDIYRVVRKNGIWSKPFNLGPNVNTVENEVFPFLVNNTLYFASDGHGGMGGLDIFKSQLTLNGFSPVINLGYPINSATDDFSIVTTADQQTGYFSSGRAGSDDLYSFEQVIEKIPMLAHIYDAATNEPLPGASIQLMTSAGMDLTLTSNDKGDVSFELPNETMFMLIGSKEGKVGMVTGSAIQQEDKLHMTHQIAALGDTTRVACVGMIKNELGVSDEASSITITDKTTGKKIEHASKQAAVSFLGEKDHIYTIEIQNEKGDTTVHEVKIKTDEKGAVTWSMVLKDPLMTMAARIVRADNDQPLGGAQVKITTFGKPDLDLVANEVGLVEFQLPLDAAYIVIGSKDELTGTHSGVAAKGTDKSSAVHVVRAAGDPPQPVTVVAMITNKSGDVLTDAVVTVTDRTTGEKIPATVENGVLTFLTERGKNYNISVEHKNHQTTLEEISIPTDAGEVEKIAVTLNDKPAVTHTLTAKVFKASDNSPLGGAQVKILNFSEPDVELVANAEGTVDFDLAEGTTFVVIGNKDGYTGMYSGTIENTTEKISVLLVPAHNDPINHVPVVARITDDKGNLLTGAEVTVRDKATGETIPAKLEDGVLTFLGVKGKDYTITVNDKDHKTASEDISIPKEAVDMEKVSIVLENREVIAPEKQMPVMATITDKKGKVLTQAQVVVTDTQTGEKVEAVVDKGVLNFTGEKGKSYSVVVEDPTHKAATQLVNIPEQAAAVDKLTVVLENKPPVLPVTTTITDKQGKVLTDAKVTVTDKATGKEIPAEVKNGVLSFNGEKGKVYAVAVDHENYQTASKDITIPATATAVAKNSVVLQSKPQQLPVTTTITDKNGNALMDAKVTVTDKATGKEIPAEVKDGVLSFNGEQGKSYSITVDHEDYQPASKDITIPATATAMDKNSIVLQGKSQKLPVSTTITDKQGNVLTDAKVIVTDKATGNQVPAEIKNGILTFDGEKGKVYSVSVDHPDYKPATEDLSIPADATSLDKNSIALESKSIQVPVTASIRSKNGDVITDAIIITATDKTTGEKIPVQSKDGVLSFDGDAGKQYTLTVESEGHQTKSQDIEIPADASSVENISITLDASAGEASALNGTQQSGSVGSSSLAPVLTTVAAVSVLSNEGKGSEGNSSAVEVNGHVLDNMGNYLEQARVTVTDKATGKEIPAKIENGVLTFMGEKGGQYVITVEHEGHKTGTREITLPMQGDGDESISVTLEKLPVFYTLSARVFKASDNSPLSGAQVKILNFSETDQELVANSEGIVDFTLMEGETFIVIGSKDEYSGMFTATVEKGMDKISVTHPVPAHPDAAKELPVVVRLSDDSGSALSTAQVQVTEKSSGQIVNAIVSDGILTFSGEKGEAYTIEVKAEGYENQQKEIQIDTQATGVKAEQINLESTEITLPSSSNLIILNAGGQNARVYISAEGSLSEIIEKDGILYLLDGDSTISLGRGNLTQLKNDPALLAQRLKLASDNVISIGNIYFDFNSAQLDARDKKELEKVKNLMQRHSSLTLEIGTHADDRGRENYNLNLSRKRGKAVEAYLENQGIAPSQIAAAAYGESAPLVKCETNDCSEEMHQRNRRAEFALSADRKITVMEVADVKSVHSNSTSKYDEMLELYGDVKKDSMVFKVSIGAYRFNHTLTFDELKDLGMVESANVEGITYYYLAGFATLREVHDMRLKVIDRGVKDAAITIFYKGDKISFLTFRSLISNQ